MTSKEIDSYFDNVIVRARRRHATRKGIEYLERACLRAHREVDPGKVVDIMTEANDGLKSDVPHQQFMEWFLS